jgi:hypothetical protein
MKNSIAFNRDYVTGLNTRKGATGQSLNTLKYTLQRLLNKETISKHELGNAIRSIGEIERFHAPKEIALNLTNSEAWIGSACGETENDWTQWIQTIAIPDCENRISPSEIETFKAQTIMVGSDRRRAHIEWGSGRKEGYIHHATSRYISTDDFLETTCPPPNIISVLPAHRNAFTGWTLQVGNIYDSADESFRWYDDKSMRWYIFFVYELGERTYVCLLDAKHLRDALSGFDDYEVTFCETDTDDQDSEIHILRGSIRIDGSYENKDRTAIIMTAKIEDEMIEKVMGCYNG